MWKSLSLIWICLFVVHASWRSGNGIDTKAPISDLHYDQHSSSVQAARKSVEERLGPISTTYETANANLVDCTACGGGGVGGHKKHSLISDVDNYNVGVGLVGYNGGKESSLSSRYTQQQQQSSQSHQYSSPIYVNPSSISSESSSALSQKYTAASRSLQVPVNSAVIIPVANDDQKESYLSHSQKISGQIHTKPVVHLSPISESEHHYNQGVGSYLSNRDSYYGTVPKDSRYISQSYHDDVQRVQSVPVSIPTYTSGRSERYNAHTEKESVQSTLPVVITEVHPSQMKPISVHSSSYNSQLPVYRQAGVQRYIQPTDNSRYTQSLIPVHSSVSGLESGSSDTQQYSRINKQSSTSNLYPQYSANSQQNYNSQSDQYKQGQIGQYGVHSGMNARYGSTSSDLSSYMSESERLARLQSQSIQQGGVRAGSSVIDSQVNSDNQLGSSIGTGTGTGTGSGYQRTKSWEKSSKWASGSEYGTGMKPKSYNYLSTAEQEHHNINGNEAGYKAATTTLNDNGKISSYSIHTP